MLANALIPGCRDDAFQFHLAGQLASLLACSLAGWLAGFLAGLLAGSQAFWFAYWLADSHNKKRNDLVLGASENIVSICFDTFDTKVEHQPHVGWCAVWAQVPGLKCQC